MVRTNDCDSLSRSTGQRQRQAREEQLREALRALLMRPLLSPKHESFNLVLRLYWPKESVLDGSWKPPAIRRVS